MPDPIATSGSALIADEQEARLETESAAGPRPSPRKDDELIAAFKDGDHSAFQDLVLRYEQRVYNHCLRMVNDEVESYDLTQEVFLKVAFYTWLYRITVNCCIDYLRRKRRHIQGVSLTSAGTDESGESGREQDIPDSSFVPDDVLLNRELDQVLHRAIGQLSEKLRAIIILKEVEGFSYEEIAEVLGCSRGTVKSRLFRARERLKELLADYVNA
jgi:RNA polymerase sigma-70 factor (ECF subfamily)